MRGQSASGQPSGDGRQRSPRKRWSFNRAWSRAKATRRKTAQELGLPDQDLAEQLGPINTPEDRSREMARFFAEADMKLSIALTHGTDPEELETLKASSRLIAELAHKRLAILGLKSGEVVEHEPSQRFQEFLDRWHAASPARKTDTDPETGEPKQGDR